MNIKKKKSKPPKVDGLGPEEIKRIRSAIRQVWSWSYAKRLVTLRCIGKNGFSYCELCKKKSPKVFIDHKIAVGELDAGFIKRLFCSSKDLQGLCKTCHDAKTKQERRDAKDFF